MTGRNPDDDLVRPVVRAFGVNSEVLKLLVELVVINPSHLRTLGPPSRNQAANGASDRTAVVVEGLSITPNGSRLTVMITRVRDLSASLDQWVLRHRLVSTGVGSVLVAAASLMIGLDAFEVITGPVILVAYLLMGTGLALVITPRRLSGDLEQDLPTA